VSERIEKYIMPNPDPPPSLEAEGVREPGGRIPERPPSVRKADFAALKAIRKLAQNPGLGVFKVHAAMRQMGFDLSQATCGWILAQVSEV
jgi:hypothetical protein